MEGHKTCKVCITEQPYINFYPHKNSKDGYRHTCKGCFGKNKGIVEVEIFCKRNKGGMINLSNCIPGCNDVCKTCPHPNESNRVGGNLTKSEEASLRYDHNTQGGHSVSYGGCGG